MVYPALIRSAVMPRLQKNVVVALLSILGAIMVTVVFSSIAFRPLGRLGKMLDVLARGEFDQPEALPPPPPRSPLDELGLMASKVSLLGEQLRGAQYDVSDLRGNLERLLDELEDAVFIFGRERRLVVASGRGGEIPRQAALGPARPVAARHLRAQYHAGTAAGAGLADRPAAAQPPRALLARRRGLLPSCCSRWRSWKA